MSKDETNQSKSKISMESSTVNILLGSAKIELEQLKQNPEVIRAFKLQETLKNMTLTDESTYADRSNQRGNDSEPRKNRKQIVVKAEREFLLTTIEKHSPINLQELYELYLAKTGRKPNSSDNDKTYKVMYGDITYLKDKGLVSKAKNIITFEKAEV